jgi:DNA-binding response OmpR family regulator
MIPQSKTEKLYCSKGVFNHGTFQNRDYGGLFPTAGPGRRKESGGNSNSNNTSNTHTDINAGTGEQVSVTVDEPGCRVFVNGSLLPLTMTEFKIFTFLHKHTGAVQTREQILNAVYGDYYGDSNSVDVNIKNIRRKAAACNGGDIIETVRGRGYVLR